jgi:Protein of unknown function (DUF3185)
MTRVLGIALMVIAAVLLVWGLDASGTVESGISRFFRGFPPDSTRWLFPGSIGAGGLGLGLLISSGPRPA